MKEHTVKRYQDTGDANSTGNLRKYAKKCWGEEVIATADWAKNADDIQGTALGGNLSAQTIMAVFERQEKGKITYLHKQHTKTDTRCMSRHMLLHTLTDKNRAEFVKWVAESIRPLNMVNDPGLHCLLKTGRPGYYVPSRSTLLQDVCSVFENARKQIGNMLKVAVSVCVDRARALLMYAQEHDSTLSFTMDAWSSPNHKSVIAVTVHFETNGMLVSFLLDIVEVARSHSSANLAAVLAQVLCDFGIEDKVSDVQFQ
jgi:hypothetical protein